MVSIITPSYNSGKFIAKTIESVINQTYKDWELIIVDDASTDNTYKIITTFLTDDKRIKLFRQFKNQGTGIARNKAIEAAKGSYIAFLDADDIWEPHKLQTQLTFMKENNISVCFSSYRLINEKGEKLNRLVEALPKLTYKKQLKCNYIGNLTGIYNAKVLGKVYMPEIKKRQDWAMWLSIIDKGGMALGIKESLAYYRVRKGSISSNKLKLIKYNFNVYRQALGFSFFKSLKHLILFFYEYFFIKTKQVKRL